MTPPTDTRRAPWEIEIRDRGSEPPLPPKQPRRRGAGRRVLALVVLGIACFLATIGLLGWLLGDGDDDERTTPSTSAPITFAPREQEPTTTAAPTTTTSSTTTTTTSTTTTTTAPTTTVAPSAGTGAVPALSRSFGGGWVAMLTSVPYSAGTARLEGAYAEVRGAAPGAVAARGEDWASLGDGYWVLVEPGPFGSEAEVRAWCAGLGGGRTDCAPRQLR